MWKVNIVFILSVLCVACLGDACTADWECGDTVYWNCAMNQISEPPCPVIIGVGVSNGNVYWLERCDPFSVNSTVYLVKDSTRELVVPENEPNLSGGVVALTAVNSEAVFVTKSTRENELVVGFSYNSSGFQSEVGVSSVRGFVWTAAFDESIHTSYVCLGIEIVRYHTLAITGNDMFVNLVYNLIDTTCNILRLDESTNTLYWSTASTFYRGNASCVNCLRSAPFYTDPDEVEDFQVYDGKLYVAAYNVGIKWMPLTDLNDTNIIVANGNINSFQIADGYIYYNDGEIKRVDLDGSNPVTISQGTPIASTNGSCECETGFTGSNCDTCSGSVQWNEGVIHCVPYNTTTGFPVSCFADYMCGNVPFARCINSVCECQTGPLGVSPQCDTCSDGGQITWSNGTPSCA